MRYFIFYNSENFNDCDGNPARRRVFVPGMTRDEARSLAARLGGRVVEEQEHSEECACDDCRGFNSGDQAW